MTSRFQKQVGETLKCFVHGLGCSCTGYNLVKGSVRLHGLLNGGLVFATLGGTRQPYQDLLAYSLNLEVSRLGDRLSGWMTSYNPTLAKLSMKQLEVCRLVDARLRSALQESMTQARRWRAFDSEFPTLDHAFPVPDALAAEVAAIRLWGTTGERDDLFAPLVRYPGMPGGYRDIWDTAKDFLDERIWVGFIAFQPRSGDWLTPRPLRPAVWRRGDEAHALPALWAVCAQEAGHGHQP